MTADGEAPPFSFSVIVPAHNEARLLPRGLAAIQMAAGHVRGRVETVVVANRCTDGTARIAADAGAVVVEDDVRNLAALRNAGADVATGNVFVTIDADSRMSPRALREIELLLGTGRVVGGGTAVVPERTSVGIRATLAVMEATTWLARISGAMFWCRADDFRTIGGFNEALTLAEDVDFARRLRALGIATGRRFVKLRSAPVTICTRKFDRLGDWHMFKMALQLRQIHAAVTGADSAWADRYFYDYAHMPPRMR
jgi:glycosyltransferase involved in cell wall biosynthesis